MSTRSVILRNNKSPSAKSIIETADSKRSDRFCSPSPFASDSEDIKIEGEDDFYQIYNLSVEAIARKNGKKTQSGSAAPRLASTSCDLEQDKKDDFENFVENNAISERIRKISNASENFDRSTGTRIIPDYVSVYSKPLSNPEINRATGLTEIADKGKGRRSRATVEIKQTHTKQEDMHRLQESKPAAKQPYLPTYIQPVVTSSVKVQTSVAVDVTNSQIRRNVHQTSTVYMSDPLKKTDRVKRAPLRLGQNRLSSGSSDSISSDVATDSPAAPKFASDSRRESETFDSVPEKATSRQTRKTRHRIRVAQRSTHNPDYLMFNRSVQSTGNVRQKTLLHEATNPHTDNRLMYSLSNTSRTPGSYHRSRTKHRKQHLVEMDERYSTLPANFSPANAAEDKLSNHDYAKTELSRRENKFSNEDDYKQPRPVNDLAITRKQAMTISEDDEQEDHNAQSDNSNQCIDSLSNQRKEAISNPQNKAADASGQSERIHNASSLVLQSRSKQVEGLRSLFNGGKVSNTVSDRTFFDQQSQRRVKVINRKATESQTPDPEKVVSSQPLLKAKKLSEDFWPRDEATEKLLNRNHAHSTESDKMTNNVLETVHEMERLPSQLTKNSDNSYALSKKDLPTSPKETNLSDPVEQQAIEGWTTRSRKQSGSSTSSYQLQGQNLYLRDVSPHTSTETLQASIRSGDTMEIPERHNRSRSLDGRTDSYLIEKLSSPKWRFDNPDSKLQEFENSTGNNSESNLSTSSIDTDNNKDEEFDETYHLNDVDLDILPMRDIYLKGAPLYLAPKYEESSQSQSENTLSADQMSIDSLPGEEASVSSGSMEDCSICRANSISGPSSGLQPISTSTRKTSVVSQSTALPRTPNGFSPSGSTEPGDTVEGCFVEEDIVSRPISMNIAAFNYPNFSLDNASRDSEVNDFNASSNNRRTRKFSAAGQSNSSSSNISSSSDSVRSRSDPIPNCKKSATSTEDEAGLVEGDFQYTMKPCSCSEQEDATMNNSVSDLSGYSENASNQVDFSKRHDVIGDSAAINQVLAEFDAKNSFKTIKKKSFSDPNAKAVLSAGLIAKIGTKQEKNSIQNSCSEPALSEQAGNTNGTSKYRSHSQTLHGTENICDSEDAGFGAVTKSIEKMSHSIYSDQRLSMSPRTFRRVPSVKARKRAEQLRNATEEGKTFKPIHPEDSTTLQNSAKTSNVVADNALEQEEEQFHKLYEMMSSGSNDNLSIIKKPVSHTRSCSEPAVGESINNRLVRKTPDRGGRRAGLVQAPSFLHKDTQSQSNLISSKPLSNSTDRISTLPTTMPLNEVSSRMDYNSYADGGKKLDMRKHVVNNLLETEASYVNSLRILFETYFKPLKRPENHSICEPRLVDEIFFQIPQILQQHQKFFANVSDCYDNWDPENIKMGEVFMQSFNKDKLLESYTSYIKNYLNAREAVNIAIQARSAFKLFLEQCQRGNKEKQGLSDLMIKPVQRIPRYELIIKDLLKHTPEGHPDRESLLIAQKEIHALSVQMNKGEKDAEAAERHSRLLQEIEQLIEGSMDIGGTSKRKFLHQDICCELKTGSKKERSLWLFNDMLVCTTSKKGGRASSLRRSSMNLFSMMPDRVMIDFTCRYKFMWKFPLDDVDLLKGSTGSNQLPNERQLQQLQNDQDLLHQIENIASKISIFHWQLDDTVKELLQVANQRITEKQQQARQSLGLPGRLEIGIPTQDGMKLFQFEFPSEENKTQFEHLFWEAKKNFTSQKSKWEPAFMKAIPISKTRNGMQFSCASPNVDTSPGTREVWVCNTDGYVGQICILTLEPEPTQTLCLTICQTKICCIAQVPPWDRKLVRTDTLLSEISVAPLGNHNTRRRSSSNSNPARYIISWDDSDESDEDNTSPISTLSNLSPHSTNTSVSNMDMSSGGNEISPSEISSGNRIPSNSMMHALLGGGAYKKDNDGSTLHGSLEDLLMEDTNNVNGGKTLSNNGSMWLGTEDGKIKIYSTSEPLKSNSRPCVQLNHTAPVQCIVHHEGQVFVALSNGDLIIYNRMANTGQWEFDSKKCLTGSSPNNPITKMIVVNDKELWCGCQNQIKILEIKNLNLKSFFPVSQDNKKQIHCMVWCGHGVWVALDKRPQVKLFNSITHDQITEIDVSHPVSKMLASSDAIIRQHKAACLRITSLLVNKDLLWVGTSAGVVLTVALPAINASTTSIPIPLMPQGLPYGHTGHVRFITSVEVLDPDSTTTGGRRSSIKRRASSASASSQIRTTALVISGGDGYEDFRMNPASEVAGREDSTNHLLVWRV